MPYTYVEACKIAGMLLKQIFVENGVPIKMHVHPSIANVNARSALGQRIMVRVCLFSPRLTQTHCKTAFRWRSHRFRSVSTRYLGRSKYGSIPTSCQDISGRSQQVHRVVSLGKEMHREKSNSLYATCVQEPRRQTARRRVRMTSFRTTSPSSLLQADSIHRGRRTKPLQLDSCQDTLQRNRWPDR